MSTKCKHQLLIKHLFDIQLNFLFLLKVGKHMRNLELNFQILDGNRNIFMNFQLKIICKYS